MKRYIEFICGIPYIGILDDYESAWMGWLVTDGDIDDMKLYLSDLNIDELASFFREVFAHAKPKLDVMLRILGEPQYHKDNYSFIISRNKNVNSYILNSIGTTTENMIILLNENLTFLQVP